MLFISSLFQAMERIKLSHYPTQGKNRKTTGKAKVLSLQYFNVDLTLFLSLGNFQIVGNILKTTNLSKKHSMYIGGGEKQEYFSHII